MNKQGELLRSGKRRSPGGRLLSMFLTLCMIVTMLPVTALAEEIHTTIGGRGEIISFAPLTETSKAVSLGSSIDDLEFAETLTATVRTAVPADENPTQDSGSPETATPTTAAEPEWEETTGEIPVTWDSPDYDPNTGGEYVFSPVIVGYTVSASLPELTVTVGAAIMGRGSAIPYGLATEIVNLAALQSAINDAADNLDLKLSDSYSGIGTITIPNAYSYNITIDLNGRTLDGGSDTAIEYKGSGTLTITDSKGGGTVTSSTLRKSGSGYGTIVADGSGTLELLGGTVSNSSNVSNESGYAIYMTNYISNQTTLNIRGGTVSATGAQGSAVRATYNNINIYGGTVSATGSGGTAISIGSGNLNIYGGTMSSVNGTAIYQESAAVTTIQRGTTVIIQGNSKAMRTAPTLSDVQGTASTDYSGSGWVDYVAANIATYKYLKFGLDVIPPALSAGSVNRTSDTAATIDFTTDKAGTAYYLVVNSGASAPTSVAVKAATSLGSASGTVTGKAVTLTAGAKDIYVVVEDSAGNISTPLKIEAAAYVAPDTTAPTVTSVTVPPNGTYSAGSNLDFTVNFDENVTVTGSPYISLTIGPAFGHATYKSGSGTTALVFRYTVQASDSDSDGISVGSLNLNDGTIKDDAGNNADLTLNSIGSTAVILVHTPVATTITSHPSPQTVNAGRDATFSVMATGEGLTYQWQVDIGSGFTNITNFGVYSGATTATLTITGTTAGMSGYQYRAVVTGTYLPAVNSNSALLTVSAAPTYTITADPTSKDFGSLTVGYTAPAAQTVTITNTGNSSVTLTQPSSTNYTIGALSTTTLAAGGTATFTVTPKTGLAVGNHNETLTVSTDHSTSATVELSFAVTAVPTYTITANPTSKNFGSLAEGYSAPAAQTVTITNTGNTSVTLTQPTSTNYTIGALSTTTLAANGTATFTVTPKAGLAVGNYNETLTVSTNHSTNATVELSFAVTAIPTYTITANPTSKNFGSLTAGYSAPTAQTITIRNTGNTSVTLTQPSSTNYTIGALSETTLAAGGTATFTVAPKAGLAVGNHDETLTVSTNQSTNATVELSFSVTAAPTYTITADPTSKNFGSLALGYSAPAAQTITITNTGNSSVTLTQPSSTKYTIGTLSKTALAAGDTATFTVTPKAGLAVGNHDETLTVSTNQSTNATVELSFSVTAVPTCIVTFNPNGGTVSETSRSVASGTAVGTLPTPTRSGSYSFDGWYTAASGGTQISASTTVSANVTYYAYWTYTGGGGSGSGGGSSSDNNSPVPGTVDITDKTVTDAFVKALAEAKKNGTEQNGIMVVLPVDTGSKSGSNVTVNLPKTVQNIIIEKKIINTILVVDNPDIIIGMDLTTIKEINRQANSDVNITATRRDSGTITGDANKAIGSRPVFDLKVNYGSDKQVQNFGTGCVTVTIPYALGTNEKAKNVQAVYVDGNGKVHWIINSVYDSVNKVLRFFTTHFSTYGVGYKEDATSFTDIANHYRKDDMEFVAARGLLEGTGAATFEPDRAITRGMLVTALGRMANADVSSYKQSSFTDVKNDANYMGYIEWASHNGILSGIDGKFSPDMAVTREHMAVILSNYTKAMGVTLEKVFEEATFADKSKISDYAKDPVKELQMAGIITNRSNNLFDPTSAATRSEVSAVLRRFIERTTGSSMPEGWIMNDSGKWMYFEKGKAVTGKKEISGLTYEFNQYGETASSPGKPIKNTDKEQKEDKKEEKPKNTSTPKPVVYNTYKVKKGDSFWKISQKYKCSMYELAKLNNKTIKDNIYPGEVLKIPKK